MNKIRYILLIINNFSHDLFTGIAISSMVAIFWVKYYSAQKLGNSYLFVLNHLGKWFSLLFISSFLVVIFTGIGRLQNERLNSNNNITSNNINSCEFASLRKSILIFKHIFLGGFFIIGGYLSFCMLF